MRNASLTPRMAAGGRILKGDGVFFFLKQIYSELSPWYLKSTHTRYSTNSGNSVINPPTLPLGECNLHYLHLSQLKCYILQEGSKRMHVGASCWFLFHTFDIVWVSAIAVLKCDFNSYKWWSHDEVKWLWVTAMYSNDCSFHLWWCWETQMFKPLNESKYLD